MYSIYIEDKVNDYVQPKDGLISPNLFVKKVHGPGVEKLHMETSQNLWLIENVVRNLSRYLFTGDTYKGFQDSLSNVEYLYSFKKKDLRDYARSLLDDIFYLDRVSIRSAISLTELAGFYLKSDEASFISDDNISDLMIEDIKLLVRRTLAFYSFYDSKVSFGPTFCCSNSEPCVFGKSDFIADNYLWDFVFTPTELDIKQALCAVWHFCMAKDNQASMRHYINLNTVGIYNPVLNTSYILQADKIGSKTMGDIGESVIGIKECKVMSYQQSYSNSLFVNGRINPRVALALESGTYYG